VKSAANGRHAWGVLLLHTTRLTFLETDTVHLVTQGHDAQCT
jgi:hypothetical protein